jgi:hypothetical protein
MPRKSLKMRWFHEPLKPLHKEFLLGIPLQDPNFRGMTHPRSL